MHGINFSPHPRRTLIFSLATNFLAILLSIKNEQIETRSRQIFTLVYKQNSHIYDHVEDQKMLQIKVSAMHCQNCRLKSRKHVIMLLTHATKKTTV
jgi:hypothetical protein